MTREKAIEILKEIIDEGWLISDFDKCTAIDACEMAIEALEQEHILDKIKAEIFAEMQYHSGTGDEVVQAYADGLHNSIRIIDKYKSKSEE